MNTTSEQKPDTANPSSEVEDKPEIPANYNQEPQPQPEYEKQSNGPETDSPTTVEVIEQDPGEASPKIVMNYADSLTV